jgi:hypothetical protein
MGVEFNEENNFNTTYKAASPTPVSGLTKWIIDKGIAKDKKSADNFMIIISIICFAVAIYFAIK